MLDRQWRQINCLLQVNSQSCISAEATIFLSACGRAQQGLILISTLLAFILHGEVNIWHLLFNRVVPIGTFVPKASTATNQNQLSSQHFMSSLLFTDLGSPRRKMCSAKACAAVFSLVKYHDLQDRILLSVCYRGATFTSFPEGRREKGDASPR